MSNVEVKVLDQRTVTIRAGAKPVDVAEALSMPPSYTLDALHPLMSGNQRDEFCVGVSLVFRGPASE